MSPWLSVVSSGSQRSFGVQCLVLLTWACRELQGAAGGELLLQYSSSASSHPPPASAIAALWQLSLEAAAPFLQDLPCLPVSNSSSHLFQLPSSSPSPSPPAKLLPLSAAFSVLFPPPHPDFCSLLSHCKYVSAAFETHLMCDV